MPEIIVPNLPAPITGTESGGKNCVDVNVVAGGGATTQYTEGDTDATITGTVALMEGAANTLLPIQGTVADGLLVNLGANNDITGTVTANAGTNLNTSLLALETGGNLAAIAASASVLDDWDESDRAKVNPIVGQAGVAGGTGVDGATVQRVSLATNVALPTGTNKIGAFEIHGSGGSTAAEVLSAGSDGTSNVFNELVTGSMSYGYNGTDWDRLRSGVGIATTGVLRTTEGSTTMQVQGLDTTGADTYATVKTPSANASHILVSLGGSNGAIISLDAGTTDHFTVPGGSVLALDALTITSGVAIQAKNATGGSNYTNLAVSVW